MDEFPIELLDPVEMSRADKIAAETLASFALMQRAGEAVARAALRRLDDRATARVVVLCGPGNNGGDGFAAARFLVQAGCEVTVAADNTEKLKGDAANAFRLWDDKVVPLHDAPIEQADLVVDALYGAGLSRDVQGCAKDVVERVNAWSVLRRGSVLAIDVPSGVDGASGLTRGCAVKASHTVTFFRLKPGHVLLPGRLLCGQVELADIGIEPTVLASLQPKTFLNTPKLWRGQFPIPGLEGHKYSRGHALVVSGPLAYTGAARLCARGALRSGAGLVTIATPAEALPVHAAALTAIMTCVAETAEEIAEVLADRRKNAVILGPGLGVCDHTRTLVQTVLQRGEVGAPPRAVVLDADALTSFANERQALFGAIASGGHKVVLTPHDGEFSKLFGGLLETSLPKPQRAREAARASGAIMVLKGADTVVASPDGRVAIAASNAPWLATAGSGDVLGGIVAGLMAQRMPAFEAAAAAVWMHADAATRYGPGLISEDIPELLPAVVAGLISKLDADALTGQR